MNSVQPSKKFLWKGKNQFGEKLKGEAIAEDASTLRTRLKEQGVISSQITTLYSFKIIFQNFKDFLCGESKKSIKADIVLFIQQLSMLISAHIPLMQALEVVGRNEKNLTKTMRKIIEDCQHQVKQGQTLSYAFNRHGTHFNPLFCRWVEAGERSGTLDTLLEHWVIYQEKNDIMRQKVKKALTYPIFILITSVIIAAVLLIGVLPVFEKLFHQFGAELPKPTQYVIMASDLFQHIGLPVGIVLITIAYVLWHIRRRLPKLHRLYDNLILKMPMSGKIVREAAIARFSRALSIMLMAGFPLSEALQWTSQLMNNVILNNAVSGLRTAVIAGTQLNQAMNQAKNKTMKTDLFPSLLKQMVAVGEVSGTLDKTLEQTANFYEKAVSSALDNLGQLIEPVIMAILGVFTGGFILAMYMPIFQLGSLF